MAPTMYMTISSPPVRAVLMITKSIGLNLERKKIDLSNIGENTTPEFLKLNPQHAVPTLEDDGYVLLESHAIMPYLFSKYGGDGSFYFSVVEKRDLWIRDSIWTQNPLIHQGKKNRLQEDMEAVYEIDSFVESFLDGRRWIAGDFVTIADFSYVTTLISLDVIVKIDAIKCPKLIAYLKRAESLNAYDINRKRLQKFVDFVKQLLC